MKRKLSLLTSIFFSLSLVSLLFTSCIRECGFNWGAVKLNVNTLELKKGEQKEIYLMAVPKRFKVEWSATNEDIASVKSSEYLSQTKGNEKIKVTISAEKSGNTILVATITCPKNKTKKLELQVSVKETSALPKPTDIISFGDKNLKRMILEAKPDADINKDGELSIKEASTIVELKLGFETKEEVTADKKITSLEGLEYFVNLESLDLKNQFITDTAPIERLSKLLYLRLAGNDIQQINLTELTKLEDLRLFGNKNLQTIDLSKCLYLKQLYLQDTSLKELDLRKHKRLELVLLNRSKLEKVAFDGLPLLENISLVENHLTEIKATNLPKLKELHANSNQLTRVTLEAVPLLERLNLYKNKLTTLQLPRLPKLMFLFLFDNQLSKIDLGNLPLLLTCAISNNPLTELDFGKNPGIRNLEAEYMPNLEKINLQNEAYNEEAEYLIAEGNGALKEVVVDKGDEAKHIRNIFKNNTSVKILEK